MDLHMEDGGLDDLWSIMMFVLFCASACALLTWWICRRMLRGALGTWEYEQNMMLGKKVYAVLITSC